MITSSLFSTFYTKCFVLISDQIHLPPILHGESPGKVFLLWSRKSAGELCEG